MGLLAEVQEELSLPDPSTARAIRRSARVSQARVAQELDVQPLAVQRWEAGTRTPRGELRRAYARILRELDQATRGARQDAA